MVDLLSARDEHPIGKVGAAREQHDATRHAGKRTCHARTRQVETFAPLNIDARERTERRHGNKTGEWQTR